MFDALRDVKFLTFGTPKIGDNRLVRLIESLEGINFVNDDDLVTILPPDKTTLLPILPIFALPALLLYTEWKRAPFQLLQDQEGVVDPWSIPTIDTPTLITMITRILLGRALDPIGGHRIGQYLLRAQARCPEPCWPIDEDLAQDIFLPNANSGLVRVDTVASGGLVYAAPLFDGLTCAKAFRVSIGADFLFDGRHTGGLWWFKLLPEAGLCHVRINWPARCSLLDWFGKELLRPHFDRPHFRRHVADAVL